MTNQIDKDINTVADWLIDQQFTKDEIVWLLQQRYKDQSEDECNYNIRDDYDNVFESLEDE